MTEIFSSPPVQLPQKQWGHEGPFHQVHKALALDEKGIIDVLPAAKQGFHIAHALGEDHIRLLHGLPGLIAQLFQDGTRHQIAIVDHGKGQAHRCGIGPGGIVGGVAAPDAEGTAQRQTSLLC